MLSHLSSLSFSFVAYIPVEFVEDAMFSLDYLTNKLRLSKADGKI